MPNVPPESPTSTTALPLPRGLVEGGVPWRKTFLRKHLARELASTSEILVLRDLPSDKPVTPREFFYAEPDHRLYQPVRVRPISEADCSLPEQFHGLLARDYPDRNQRPAEVFDLTALLQILRDRKDPRSILLEARSGAGKTVAGLAAMFDCFYADDRPRPRLDGLLPCVLRLGGEEGAAAEAIEGKAVTAWRFIADSVARSAGFTSHTDFLQVEQYLRIGPPLLLLVDLNAVDIEKRKVFAGKLSEFLRSDTARKVGHRAVVTYRSHAQDKILERLREVSWDERRPDDQIYLRVELEPLAPPASFHYLQNLRRVKVRLHDGPEPDDATLESEARMVRDLLDRFDHAEGSLVSIPLLLYFVGLVGAKALERATSLAALYNVVVEAFLKRESDAVHAANETLTLVEQFDEKSVRTAMSRVALVILAQGVGSTKLTGDQVATVNLNALFEKPQKVLHRYLPGGTTAWIHPNWSDSPYIKSTLPPMLNLETGRGLGEHSFLRRSGSEVGFLHDSFLYYFAAWAIRYPRDPHSEAFENCIDEIWRQAAIHWWQVNPSLWTETIEFLGGMLPTESVRDLACDMIVTRSQPGWPGLISRLLRVHVPTDDSLVNALDFALHHKEGLLDRVPTALFSEVYHYFRDGSRNRTLFAESEVLRARYTEPWLRSDPIASPTYWPLSSMVRHRGEVACVALLPDGRVVSGGEDGLVILWDPRRYTTYVIHRHDWWVRAVAVSADGRVIVSGGSDGAVRRAIDGIGEPEPLFFHDDQVQTVALSGDGRVIVSGGSDHVVRRVVDGIVDAKPLLNHRSLVWSVGISADGRVIVSGGGRTVRRAIDGIADRRAIYKHDDVVRSVAVSADGLIIASGGNDGAVRRAIGGKPDRLPVYFHRGAVSLLSLSADGSVIASIGHDNALRRSVNGVPDSDPLHLYQWKTHDVKVSADGHVIVHAGDNGEVRWATRDNLDSILLWKHNATRNQVAVAVSSDGRVTASCGCDGVVRQTVDGVPDPPHLFAHSKAAKAVAISHDGSVVVSSGDDAVIRRAVNGVIDEKPLLLHDKAVWAVTVSGNGEVIFSGGGDGAVRRAVKGIADKTILYSHKGLVYVLTTNFDGSIVNSGGWDCAVRRAVHANPATKPINTHDTSIWAIASSADAKVVASAGDHAVRRAVDGIPDAEALYHHEGRVFALAVSSDGRVIVSGGNDGVVWRSVDGIRDTLPLCRHEGVVRDIIMSDDGRVIVSTGDDGVIWRACLGFRDPMPLDRHNVRLRALSMSVDGKIIVGAEFGPCIRLYYGDSWEATSFLTNSEVNSIALARKVPLIVASLQNGEVLHLWIENIPDILYTAPA